jgi:hypothetical protein
LIFIIIKKKKNAFFNNLITGMAALLAYCKVINYEAVSKVLNLRETQNNIWFLWSCRAFFARSAVYFLTTKDTKKAL